MLFRVKADRYCWLSSEGVYSRDEWVGCFARVGREMGGGGVGEVLRDERVGW